MPTCSRRFDFQPTDPPPIPSSQLLRIFQGIVKLLDDAEAPARSASAQCLGVMVKKLGEGPMAKYLGGVDPTKMGRITAAADEAGGAAGGGGGGGGDAGGAVVEAPADEPDRDRPAGKPRGRT